MIARDELNLPDTVTVDLRRFAEAGYPHEVCGLLVGRRTRVDYAVEVANVEPSRTRDRFTLDPAGFLHTELEAEATGREILGIWHTHPDHPARPSPTDLAAAWEGYSYLIVSVRNAKVAELRSWRLVDGAFREEAISGGRP